MQNDVSRQWALLTPLVPGDMLTAQAQQVEAAGMAGVFIPEIYSDPFMGMGYCAAVTSRIKVASGIKIAFASNPFEIAMTAMDLDRLSDGRVVLGLGTSIKNWVNGFHGQPYSDTPVAQLRESIQIIREVFAKSHIPGGLQTFEG
jgi:alkanesulfonate monooxygenase SsuD/methylene tetrahydromethanopterin reductase-like flavin-dependent oxidoreductase (luciferase family)